MLTLILALNTAAALDCDFSAHSQPVDGATDIATSASIIIQSPFGQETRDYSLLDAGGAAVAATQSAVSQGSTRIVVLTPDAPLAASATYTFGIPSDGGDDRAISFTTGSAADTEAPSDFDAGDVTAVNIAAEDSDWGPEHALIAAAGDATDDDPIRYEFQFDTAEDFSAPLSVVSLNAFAMYGEGLCDHTVEDPDVTALMHIRARAIDLSGNATGWIQWDTSYAIDGTTGESEPTDTGDTGGSTDTGDGSDTGDGGETGCSAIGGSGLAIGWLTLGLLGLTRRRDGSLAA